jgi:uncharacterized protein (TIGR03067 family)
MTYKTKDQDPTGVHQQWFTFAEGSMTRKSTRRGIGTKYKLVLRPEKSPAEFDMIEEDMVYPGIYKLEGDMLTIIYCELIKSGRPPDLGAADRDAAFTKFVCIRAKPAGKVER